MYQDNCMENNTMSTPPSSPPSSPVSYRNTSSPPASPALDAMHLEDDSGSDARSASGRTTSSSTLFEVPMDPLAGSYHANRRKRSSYTFLNSPPQTPQPKKARYSENASPNLRGEHSALFDVTGKANREKLLWDAAIEAAFENGERKINLTDCNITSIPPHAIKDLGKIVVLPESGEPLDKNEGHLFASSSSGNIPGKRTFTRVHTAPASMPLGWGRLSTQGKTVSSNSILGMSREAMDLFLGRNNIAKLPVELWRLNNLTVLSLRNNNITYLPPQIAQLKALQSLNIAHNKLRFIPAELLTMKKLNQLHLFPNPFIPEPPAKTTETKSVFTGSPVPSLTELALRILLSPPADVPLTSPCGTFKTKLEQTYELPLPTGENWRPLSASLRHILSVCVPGSIIDDEQAMQRWDDDSKEMTGISVCPNPAHGSFPRVFVEHAEERYTWTTSTSVIKQLGGSAAVLWRGCSRGCLDFLDADDKEKDKEVVEESKDGDDEDIIQPVLIAPLGFD